MDSLLERIANPLHVALAIVAGWLVFSSPWVELYKQLPADAGWITHLHVWLGWAALLLGLLYLVVCARGGRWRLYFPWAGGQMDAVRRDVAGIFRGEVPSVEGGGLFALIEGLLLLALVGAGLTGALWFMTEGTSAAVGWREWHLVAARAAIALLVLHVVSVSLHLLDFVRG
ncbi:MAG: cytochrome b/b6 domain-containing protein [Burkholderiaceae bacterium]|nr:cytochrome b/b6 domain-containing protein [Burkholderiaceae bacterium]